MIALRNDGATGLHEVVKTVGRHEVFVQDVGPQRVMVVQRGHGFVEQGVPGGIAGEPGGEPRLDLPAPPLCPFAAGLRPKDQARGMAEKARTAGRRTVARCRGIGHKLGLGDERGTVDVHAAIGHRGRMNGTSESRGKGLCGQALERRGQKLVGNSLDLQPGDQADQALAAHVCGKHLRVVLP